MDVEAGQFLFGQGEQANSLFIIEAGQVSILLTRDSHQDLRVQTLGSGSLVGEMDVFLKHPIKPQRLRMTSAQYTASPLRH